jgi:hypothetical protein
MDDQTEDEIGVEDDFDEEDIEEEEENIEFGSDEIEDYRDLESKSIKFANQTLDIDLTDEHHCTLYVVPDNDRTTSQIMTLEEMTEAVGIRITEIENGAPCFTDVTGYTCPIEMAKKELLDGKSPYKLIREMSNKKGSKVVEIWKINEMTLPITRRATMQITKNRIAELGLSTGESPKASPVVDVASPPVTPVKSKPKKVIKKTTKKKK